MTIKEKLEMAIKKWDLSGIEAEYENSHSAVYFAVSEVYGDVVLKINANNLFQEYRVLREFSERCSCKTYDYDEAEYMLLEERILPGIELRSIGDVNERLEYFVTVFQNIHDQAKGEYVTYIDWLSDAYIYCCDNRVNSVMMRHMSRALEIGKEVFDKYPERVLLHGDLHHDNILLDSDGNYKIIDPKGVIGPAILDIPRFVMNELDSEINKTGAEHIKYIIDKLAETLRYDSADIRKLFFMEVILANVWCMEDGEEVKEDAVKIALEVLVDDMNLRVRKR